MTLAMFGYQNAVKTAALVGSSSAPGLDVSQLQNNDSGAASMAWQCTFTSGTLRIATAAVTTFGAVCIARSNITAAALWSIRVFSDSTETVLNFNAGSVSGAPTLAMNVVNGQAVYIMPAGVSGKEMRIDFTDSANPEGYVNIPLIYAGPVFQPLRALSWNTTRGRDQRVDEIVTRSGVEFPQHRWDRRRWSLDAQSIGAAEYPTFQAIDSQARLGGNVLFIPDPASATLNADAIFGRLTPKADFGFMPGGTRLTWKADITERL